MTRAARNRVDGICSRRALPAAIVAIGLLACKDSDGARYRRAARTDPASLSGSNFGSLAFDGVTLYGGTRENGVLQSSDLGKTWMPSGSGTEKMWVASLVVTPRALYAGAFGAGVLERERGTRAWAPMNEGLAEVGVNALVRDGPTLYAATNGGVFRTADEGKRWTAFSDGLPGPYVRCLATDGEAIYASTIRYEGQPSRMFRSEDGKPWRETSSGLPQETDIWAISAYAHALFTGTINGVFRSTDRGVTWAALNEGLTDLYVTALSAGPVLYAGTYSGQLFQSRDQGWHWSLRASPGRPILSIALGPRGEVCLATTTGVVTLN